MKSCQGERSFEWARSCKKMTAKDAAVMVALANYIDDVIGWLDPLVGAGANANFREGARYLREMVERLGPKDPQDPQDEGRNDPEDSREGAYD
jgi:hypothetical protein